MGRPAGIAEESPDLGAAVVVAGYPGVGGDTLTVTRGTVSGFLDIEDGLGRVWLKTDAEINPGNSGGGALDKNGALIGIPTFIVLDKGGALGYVLGIPEAKALLGRSAGRVQAVSLPTKRPQPAAAAATTPGAAPTAVPTPRPTPPPLPTQTGPNPLAARTAEDLRGFLRELLGLEDELLGWYKAANSSGSYKAVAPTISAISSRATSLQRRIESYRPAASFSICLQAQAEAARAAQYFASEANFVALSFANFPTRAYDAAETAARTSGSQNFSAANGNIVSCALAR